MPPRKMPETGGWEMGEREKFCSDMANGLHAMAQPLTILRSTMVACGMLALAEADRKRYLDISAEQVERACEIFQSLQQLLIANQIEAECAPLDLAELLAPFAAEDQSLFDAPGIALKVIASEDLPAVIADKDRTLQTLFAVLKIAVSQSDPGDAIELQTRMDGGFAEVLIRNSHARGRKLNSTERLNLSLAEANVRIQQGRFETAENPFQASLVFPTHSFKAAKAGAEASSDARAS